MPVTLVTLFSSYNQFYRAECITVSGFFSKIVCKINSVNVVARKQKCLICDFVYTAYTLILLMLLKLLTLLTLLTLFTLLTQQ